MFSCFYNVNKTKCSWCKEYKEESRKISFYCKHYKKNLCKSCYDFHYLEKSKIPFEQRTDLFF